MSSFKAFFFSVSALSLTELSFTRIKDCPFCRVPFSKLQLFATRQLLYSRAWKKPSRVPPHTCRAFSGVRLLSEQMEQPVYREVLKAFAMLLSTFSLPQPQGPSLLRHPSFPAALQITQKLWNIWLVLPDSLLSDSKEMNSFHRQSYQAWVLMGIGHCYPECNEKWESQHFAIDLPLQKTHKTWNILKAFSKNFGTKTNFITDVKTQ